jgi:beta-phosphoglucomutase-like phosphatase (HAD superfamily)
METAKLNLDALGIDPAVIPVVARDQVKYAKPDPDLFLAARMMELCIVVFNFLDRVRWYR